MDVKQKILKVLKGVVGEDVSSLLEIPPDPVLGDYALPCFSLSKRFKKPPHQIALELEREVSSPLVERVEEKGPYVNVFVKKEVFAKEVLGRIRKEKGRYGCSSVGRGKRIVIDMSSPNIAKPFGVGHLRSTMIGNALRHCFVSQGYKVVRVNHVC